MQQQEHAENRSGGHEFAVHTLVACGVCSYEMPRGAMSCPRCGQPGPESRTPRMARKRRNVSKIIVGTIMMLAGGMSFFFFIPFPFNLVVAPTVLILGAATASKWQCGRCHAEVDRGAVECPRCALLFTSV